MIPLSSAGAYPTTEQTLGAVSLILNGGGIAQVQEITHELSTAFMGRENDLRSLIEQLDLFIQYNNDQKDDIIAAAESLDNLVGQIAEQKPVVDEALRTSPTPWRCSGTSASSFPRRWCSWASSALLPPTR